MDVPVKLIKGNYYKRRVGKVRKKTIAFDFDETIGHFKHLKMIYHCIDSLTQYEFNMLLDMYPEFFRPGIMSIMEFLASKKKTGDLCKLCIYTNNQCNGDWVQMVANYIQTKVEYPGLFDDIIKAFKQGNKIIEMRRTTKSKTYSDYVSCIMLPEDTVETCFIDDKYYEKMFGDRVYYIWPKAYYHRLSKATMIKRIMSSPLRFKTMESNLVHCIEENLHKGDSQIEKEIAISKKIMFLVREYLYYPKLPTANTTRRRINKGRVTTQKNNYKFS